MSLTSRSVFKVGTIFSKLICGRTTACIEEQLLKANNTLSVVGNTTLRNEVQPLKLFCES